MASAAGPPQIPGAGITTKRPLRIWRRQSLSWCVVVHLHEAGWAHAGRVVCGRPEQDCERPAAAIHSGARTASRD